MTANRGRTQKLGGQGHFSETLGGLRGGALSWGAGRTGHGEAAGGRRQLSGGGSEYLPAEAGDSPPPTPRVSAPAQKLGRVSAHSTHALPVWRRRRRNAENTEREARLLAPCFRNSDGESSSAVLQGLLAQWLPHTPAAGSWGLLSLCVTLFPGRSQTPRTTDRAGSSPGSHLGDPEQRSPAAWRRARLIQKLGCWFPGTPRCPGKEGHLQPQSL